MRKVKSKKAVLKALGIPKGELKKILALPKEDENGCLIPQVNQKNNSYVSYTVKIGSKYKNFAFHRLWYQIQNKVILDPDEKILHAQTAEYATSHNKHCCNIDHLRVGSYADNSLDSCEDGMARKKLLPREVFDIVNDLKAGYKQDYIAVKHEISRKMVSNINTGKSWSHYTGIKPKTA